MKTIQTYSLLIGVLLLLGTVGCINDDELNFPEDRSDEITSTIEVITLLNAFDLTDDLFDCFEPVFPLELAYNNELIVSVEDLDGLIEVIDNQTSNFFIEGIVLPVLVDKSGVLSSIEEIDDLQELLEECELPVLKDLISSGRDQCFEFVYPLTLVSGGDTILVDDDDGYDEFKSLQGQDFNPTFLFPVNIERFSTDREVTIQNHFDLLREISACKPCVEGDIKIIPEFDGFYTFVAKYDDLIDPVSYTWYLNDELIGDGTSTSLDSLTLQLPNNEYELCLKSFGPDCVEGTVTCTEFVVDRGCPEVFFTVEESLDSPKLLFFYADASLLEGYSFEWSVYLNEELIYEEEESPKMGDGKLAFEFQEGFYTVCLEKEDEVINCEVTEYCKEFFFQ